MPKKPVTPKKTQDKLVAATLAEAQQHLDTFRRLADDNDVLNADYKLRKEGLDRQITEIDAASARQRNTTLEQDKRTAFLDDREAELKEARLKLEYDRAAFESEKTKVSADHDEREERIFAAERAHSSAVLAFEKRQQDAAAVSEAKAAELDDREDRLKAGESRLHSDAAAFAEERQNWKEKERSKILADLGK